LYNKPHRRANNSIAGIICQHPIVKYPKLKAAIEIAKKTINKVKRNLII